MAIHDGRGTVSVRCMGSCMEHARPPLLGGGVSGISIVVDALRRLPFASYVTPSQCYIGIPYSYTQNTHRRSTRRTTVALAVVVRDPATRWRSEMESNEPNPARSHHHLSRSRALVSPGRHPAVKQLPARVPVRLSVVCLVSTSLVCQSVPSLVSVYHHSALAAALWLVRLLGISSSDLRPDRNRPHPPRTARCSTCLGDGYHGRYSASPATESSVTALSAARLPRSIGALRPAGEAAGPP
jgi:hypothetical protein